MKNSKVFVIFLAVFFAVGCAILKFCLIEKYVVENKKLYAESFDSEYRAVDFREEKEDVIETVENMNQLIIEHTNKDGWKFEDFVVQYDGDGGLSEEELFYLACLICKEAGASWAKEETRVLVGEVALNRVMSEYFPDTLYNVLTQEKRQYGWTKDSGVYVPINGRGDLGYSEFLKCADTAVTLLLSEERLSPENVVFQARFKQGDYVFMESDGEYFCGKY